jgi:hypothetical protein
LWTQLFAYRFTADACEEMAIRLRENDWKRGFFAWRTWELLNDTFDVEEDAADSIVVRVGTLRRPC